MHINGGTEAPRSPKKTGDERAQMLSEKSGRDEIRTEDRLTMRDGVSTRQRKAPGFDLHQESKWLKSLGTECPVVLLEKKH